MLTGRLLLQCYLSEAAEAARARQRSGDAGPLRGVKCHIVPPLAARCAVRVAVLNALLGLLGGARCCARSCDVCILSHDNSSGRAQPPPVPPRLGHSTAVVLDSWLVAAVETGVKPPFGAHAPPA
jgi:hypothetical protein